MDLQIPQYKTIAASPSNRYSSLLHHSAHPQRHNPLSERHRQNKQLTTHPSKLNTRQALLEKVDFQVVYTAIKGPKHRNSSWVNEVARSLNGTWFRSTMANRCEFTAKSLFSNLPVRRRSESKTPKKNPELQQNSFPEKQYRQPNIFPSRPASSQSTHHPNTHSHQRTLTNDYLSFRSAQVEGKAINCQRNEGWFKDQVLRSSGLKDRRGIGLQEGMKANAKRGERSLQEQSFGLFGCKAKLNL